MNCSTCKYHFEKDGKSYCDEAFGFEVNPIKTIECKMYEEEKIMRKCRYCDFLNQSMAGNLLCSKKQIGKNIVRLYDTCDIKELKDKSSNAKKFIELMEQLKSLVIFDNSQENVIQCPTCAGLRIMTQQDPDGTYYITKCNTCFNGTLHVCPFCGKHNQINRCDCHGYYENQNKEEQEKEDKYIQNMKSKNKIINIENYSGYIVWGDDVIDKDDLRERLEELMHDGENINPYAYGTSKETNVVYINLEEAVYNACESGYEEMEHQFNYKSEKFIQAQKLIDEWLDEHKDENTMYSEDRNKVIDLSKMIEEVKNEISNS